MACDKVTRKGYWVLDKSDRKYVDVQHFPKKQLCFIALAGAMQKPFVELIPMGQKLNAKRLNIFEKDHFDQIFRYVRIMRRLVAHLKESQEDLAVTTDDFLKIFANLPFKLMQDALIQK